MHIHVQKKICDTHVSPQKKLGHKVWVFMATIRRGLAAAMSLAQAAREQQKCRSQAITPRLSGRAARWCTKIIEN
jgi:hypothetical protein